MPYSTRRLSLSCFARSLCFCLLLLTSSSTLLSPILPLYTTLAASAVLVDIFAIHAARSPRRQLLFAPQNPTAWSVAVSLGGRLSPGTQQHCSRNPHVLVARNLYNLINRRHGVDSVWELSCKSGNEFDIAARDVKRAGPAVAWATRGACVRLTSDPHINRTFVATPLFPCAM